MALITRASKVLMLLPHALEFLHLFFLGLSLYLLFRFGSKKGSERLKKQTWKTLLVQVAMIYTITSAIFFIVFPLMERMHP